MGQTKISVLSSLLSQTVWLSFHSALTQITPGNRLVFTSQKTKVHLDSNKGAVSVTNRYNKPPVTFLFWGFILTFTPGLLKIATVCCSSTTTTIITTNTSTTLPQAVLQSFICSRVWICLWFSARSRVVFLPLLIWSQYPAQLRGVTASYTYENKDLLKKKQTSKKDLKKKKSVYDSPLLPLLPPFSPFWHTYGSSMHIWYSWLLFFVYKRKMVKKDVFEKQLLFVCLWCIQIWI